MVNRLERLAADIEIYLFDAADKLPTRTADRKEKVNPLSKNTLILNIRSHLH